MNDNDFVHASAPLSGGQSRTMLRSTARNKALQLSGVIKTAVSNEVLLAKNDVDELWLFIEAAQSPAIP